MATKTTGYEIGQLQEGAQVVVVARLVMSKIHAGIPVSSLLIPVFCEGQNC